jgi:hypothetical protein
MSPGPILSQLNLLAASVGSGRVTASIFPGTPAPPRRSWAITSSVAFSREGPNHKINSVLDPNLAYRDTSLADGTTYYYVTTSVNSNDEEYEESVYSNEAQATIS